MCGIIGIINSDGRLGERELASLNDTMRLRGPDGTGLFWEGQSGIAMRRLAIIDLAGGQQPIFSEDRNVVVVMNGEIYNYPALREDLIAAGHHFSTRSDTETLVHGYEEFGIDGLLERIDGMYAFAIWDRPRRRIFLARDRFGEKPLYIAGEGATILFGSQLLTVVAGLRQTPPISAEALQLYWALHFVPGDGTIFQGVRRVRPAEAYEFDVGSGNELRRWRYWRLREHRQRRPDPGEMAQLLEQAVHSRLIADVPVGVFLSGGLDSSLVASLAAQHVPRIQTFSIGFDSPRHDESGYAWEVADYIGATHHHVMFQLNEFRSHIPEVIASMDEPLGDQAMLPLYALAQQASKEVKVVLSGEGADELFAGYSYYGPSAPAPSRDWVGRALSVGDGANGQQPYFIGEHERTASGFPTVLPRAVREHLSKRAPAFRSAWHDEFLTDLAAVRDPLRRATLCDILTWLSEDLLMKADKMTMAHSLEGRMPYLAPVLADAAFNLPAEDKLADGSVKVFLRQIAQQHLPSAICGRRKQGWVLPIQKWLTKDLRDDVVEAIRACKEGLIDRAYMEALFVQGHASDGTAIGERALYAMMVMVKWLTHADRKVAETRAEQRKLNISGEAP
ncbi:MAG: asparagine synthase (glutamine-hydrolyzing) [Candidatus Methylomirabilis sp.]